MEHIKDNLLFLSCLTVSAVSLFCTKMKLQLCLEVSKIWVQFKSKYLHQQYFHCLHNYIAAEIRGRKITTSFTFAAQNSILFIVQMNTSLINQFHNIYIFSLLFLYSVIYRTTKLIYIFLLSFNIQDIILSFTNAKYFMGQRLVSSDMTHLFLILVIDRI